MTCVRAYAARATKVDTSSPLCLGSHPVFSCLSPSSPWVEPSPVAAASEAAEVGRAKGP